jgi:hypothetical protein
MALYGAIGAAVEKRRKKQLLEKLEKLDAIDIESAVHVEKICEYWYDKYRIEDLIKKGKIRKTADGRLYLPCKK